MKNAFWQSYKKCLAHPSSQSSDAKIILEWNTLGKQLLILN